MEKENSIQYPFILPSYGIPHKSTPSLFACGTHKKMLLTIQQKPANVGSANDSGVIAVSMADYRANIDIIALRPRFFQLVGEPSLI
jgi:hypothetical protein